MPELISIYRRNAETFYNYRTGDKHSQVLKNITIIIIAAIGSVVFGVRSDNVYLGVITAQSILAGFSFNLMFTLSSNDIANYDKTGNIEQAGKAERLNKLSKESFYNITYFNVVAIASVVFSLLLLLGGSVAGPWLHKLCNVSRMNCDEAKHVWDTLGSWMKDVVLFLAYVTILESIMTFVRTVQRVSYLFDEKMKLRAEQEQNAQVERI